MSTTTAAAAPPTWHSPVSTALGELTLVRDDAHIRGVYFRHHWRRPTAATLGSRSGQGFAELIAQLEQYLAGDREQFELPLAAVGDEFHRAVWQCIGQIPYGRTRTYGELAAEVGDGASAQQVGAAVGRNPLSILVPCHRVVGSGGKLTGYAGGLVRKRHLLDLERDRVAADSGTPVQPGLFAGLPPAWR